MLRALEKRNIDFRIRRWIKYFLTKRQITYELSGKKYAVLATKGAPQGGVLSPLLWILVMDELLVKLKNAGYTVIGYADDLVLICRGKFISTLCDLTQNAL